MYAHNHGVVNNYNPVDSTRKFFPEYLQEAGYIKVEKTFKNNYPNTTLSITDKGREAFETYVNDLKKYINPVK